MSKSIDKSFMSGGNGNKINPSDKPEKKPGRRKENPLSPGGTVPYIRSYHAVPFNNMNEILPVYGAFDNDLAEENTENDLGITAADMQDFRKMN